MRIEFPECGRIVNTHGCRGEVKIESYCDSPDTFLSLPLVYLKSGDEYTPLHPVQCRIHKGAVIVKFREIADMNVAERMKGTTLYARREDVVPSGSTLLLELIGLPVIDAKSGRCYGEVTDVERGVASDLYTVKTESGEVLFPAVKEFLKEIREDAILVSPVEGLFDEV